MADIWSRTSEDRQRDRIAVAFASGLIAALFAFAAVSQALAQQDDGTSQQSPPTYQRKGTFAQGGQWKQDDRRRRPMPRFSSQTNAGSFQRPYPYHLDYYRMKWGGSYEPYFGNLYGPPNYFFSGTPFYGGFGPSYGFGGFPAGGFDNRFGGFGAASGFGGGPNGGGVPYGPWAGQGMGPMGMPNEGDGVP